MGQVHVRQPVPRPRHGESPHLYRVKPRRLNDLAVSPSCATGMSSGRSFFSAAFHVIRSLAMCSIGPVLFCAASTASGGLSFKKSKKRAGPCLVFLGSS